MSSSFQGLLRQEVNADRHAEGHRTLVDQAGNEFCLECACDVLSKEGGSSTTLQQLSIVACLNQIVVGDAAGEESASGIMRGVMTALVSAFGGDCASTSSSCAEHVSSKLVEKLKGALIALAGLLSDRATDHGSEFLLERVVHEVSTHGVAAQSSLLKLLGHLVARAQDRAESTQLLRTLCSNYGVFLERVLRSAMTCRTTGPLCDTLYICSSAAMLPPEDGEVLCARVVFTCLMGVAESLVARLERSGNQACWVNGLTCLAALALALERGEFDDQKAFSFFDDLVHVSGKSTASVRLGIAGRAQLLRHECPVAVCAAARMFSAIGKISTAATRSFIRDGVANCALEALASSDKGNTYATIIKWDLANLLDQFAEAEPIPFFHLSHFHLFALQALIEVFLENGELEGCLAATAPSFRRREESRGVEMHQKYATTPSCLVSLHVARSTVPLARLLRRTAEYSSVLDHLDVTHILRAIGQRIESLLNLVPNGRRFSTEESCLSDDGDGFDPDDDVVAWDSALYECLLTLASFICRFKNMFLPGKAEPPPAPGSMTPVRASTAPKLRADVRAIFHVIFVNGKVDDRSEKVLSAAIYAIINFVVAIGGLDDEENDALWAFQLLFHRTSSRLWDRLYSLSVSTAATVAVFVSLILQKLPSSINYDTTKTGTLYVQGPVASAKYCQQRRQLARQLCEQGYLMIVVHNLSDGMGLEERIDNDDQDHRVEIMVKTFSVISALLMVHEFFVADGLERLAIECSGVSLDTLALKLIDILRRSDVVTHPRGCIGCDNPMGFEDELQANEFSMAEVVLFVLSPALVPSSALRELDTALVGIINSHSQLQGGKKRFSGSASVDLRITNARTLRINIHVLNIVGGFSVHDKVQATDCAGTTSRHPSYPSEELITTVKNELLPQIAFMVRTPGIQKLPLLTLPASKQQSLRSGETGYQAQALEIIHCRAILFLLNFVQCSHLFHVSSVSISPCEELIWAWVTISLLNFSGTTLEYLQHNLLALPTKLSPLRMAGTNMTAGGIVEIRRRKLVLVILARLAVSYHEEDASDLCRACSLVECMTTFCILRSSSVNCGKIGFLQSIEVVKRLHEILDFSTQRWRFDIATAVTKSSKSNLATLHNFNDKEGVQMLASAATRHTAALVTLECLCISKQDNDGFSPHVSARDSSEVRSRSGSGAHSYFNANGLLDVLLHCTPSFRSTILCQIDGSVQAVSAFSAIAGAALRYSGGRRILDALYKSHSQALTSLALRKTNDGDPLQAAVFFFLLLTRHPVILRSQVKGCSSVTLQPLCAPSELMCTFNRVAELISSKRISSNVCQEGASLALHLCSRMLYIDHFFCSQTIMVDGGGGTSTLNEEQINKRNCSPAMEWKSDDSDNNDDASIDGSSAHMKSNSGWAIRNGKVCAQLHLAAQHHALTPSSCVSEAACALMLLARATIIRSLAPSFGKEDSALRNGNPRNPSCCLFAALEESRMASDWSGGWHRIVCEEVIAACHPAATFQPGPFALLLLASTVRSAPCWRNRVFGKGAVVSLLLSWFKTEIAYSHVVEKRCLLFLFGCLLHGGLLTRSAMFKLRAMLLELPQYVVSTAHRDPCRTSMNEKAAPVLPPSQSLQSTKSDRANIIGVHDPMKSPQGIDWASGMEQQNWMHNEHVIHPSQLGRLDQAIYQQLQKSLDVALGKAKISSLKQNTRQPEVIKFPLG
jgi:hypothetical protein